MHVASEWMEVQRVEPIEGGFRVTLATGRGTFEVKETVQGPRRLKRVSKAP